MKVIFLDVDGVINNEKTTAMINGWTFVDDYLIKIVRHIINKTHAKVVLSSTWREGWDGQVFGMEFEALKEKCEYFGVHFFDKTDWTDMGHRDREICDWLDMWSGEPIESYVVLDDAPGCFFGADNSILEHLVQTDPRVGITLEDAEKAIAILNNCYAK